MSPNRGAASLRRKTAAVFGFACAGLAVYLGFSLVWSPLQRHYLGSYLRSALCPPLLRYGTYSLLCVVSKDGKRTLARDEDVVPIPAASSEEVSFAPSDDVERRGARLVTDTRRRKHDSTRKLLVSEIYAGGHSFAVLLVPAVPAGLLGGLLFWSLPGSLALLRERARKEGQRLRGPQLVTIRSFNRKQRRGSAPGIGFDAYPYRPGQSKPYGRSRRVCIPRAMENRHISIVGDTGTGKSTLLRQLLLQIEERGETAIVFDPAIEFLPQFYRQDRGDQILNPFDARMPYWSIGDEICSEAPAMRKAEATALATALCPDRPGENRFFVESARKVIAHLLTQRPTPQALVEALSEVRILDRSLEGTPIAHLTGAEAPAQRNGVLGSLALTIDSLESLPERHESSASWSAAEWSRQRCGWLFLSSVPEARDELKTLTSVWLDMLILRLMNPLSVCGGAVWLILDELASLFCLPQLPKALTQGRKANIRLVLGFQGRSQLYGLYGQQAETMLSQPATKIFLGTSDADAARWVSEMIGAAEYERLQRSDSSSEGLHQQSTTSYAEQRTIQPLVMPSEVQDLPDHCGYMKLKDQVLPLRFAPALWRPRQPPLIERPVFGRSREKGGRAKPPRPFFE